jgi:hypothetical protein
VGEEEAEKVQSMTAEELLIEVKAGLKLVDELLIQRLPESIQDEIRLPAVFERLVGRFDPTEIAYLDTRVTSGKKAMRLLEQIEVDSVDGLVLSENGLVARAFHRTFAAIEFIATHPAELGVVLVGFGEAIGHSFDRVIDAIAAYALEVARGFDGDYDPIDYEASKAAGLQAIADLADGFPAAVRAAVAVGFGQIVVITLVESILEVVGWGGLAKACAGIIRETEIARKVADTLAFPQGPRGGFRRRHRKRP